MADDVETFIAGIAQDRKREDSRAVLKLLQEESGYTPYLTGSMVGFGRYHYKYASGREGDWFVTGFSPRKQNLAVYIMPGFSEYGALLDKLGKHKLGKSCLYINKLADIDVETLRQLVRRSVKDMQKKYRCTDA
jgi:hypothetical protein